MFLPVAPSLLDHFAALEDPRQSWKVLYPLPEVLLVLCGTLAGAENSVEVRRWGQVRQDFLCRLLPYKAGLPSHDVDWFNSARRYPGASSFPGVRAIAMVEGEVERGGKTSLEWRYVLSSLPLDARLFAQAVRCHWHVENRLRWVLGVVFHEDLSRLRSGYRPQDMATVRHMAMNLLRGPKDKQSVKVYS